MSVALVAAVAKNRVIGKSNTLPWYLPEDLKRFKELTTGKMVVMGRKTFESILRRLGHPLPDRKNIVITREADYKVPEGVTVYHSVDEAMDALKDQEVMVIGGGEVYMQTIDRAAVLYITHIDREVDGDVYFPVIDPGIWIKNSEEPHDGFSFAVYKRKQ